jgi:hypothetical protein
LIPNWIAGNATVTIVLSSMIMNIATVTVASDHHLRLLRDAATALTVSTGSTLAPSDAKS